MLRNFCFLMSVLLPLFGGSVLANGDIAAGKSKSVTCSACHGQDGNGVESLPMQPRLAGQHAEYTAKQLRDYQSKARENAIMAPMIAALSEEDINDISAYYASLKGTIGSSSAELLETGETLYRAGNAETGLAACMACHGPSGRGNPAAKYPALSGQWAEYTKIQLMAFKSETRSNDLSAVMRDVATKMSKEEIEAVSNYIQGLH
ncbi:MAG: c-type cytochrome [Gammaproteobacteria bacterium]|nr:c-type cytochrome [Gammaproteobacteria bacterium]